MKFHCSVPGEKIKKYSFSPDRADVIDCALEIFQVITANLQIESITSSKWGVSDSMAVKLFHEIYSNKVSIT
jgi:exopolyphosphatase/guanosine-5'-triphosphate,3'-diphosphate pyrophosphatase